MRADCVIFNFCCLFIRGRGGGDGWESCGLDAFCFCDPCRLSSSAVGAGVVGPVHGQADDGRHPRGRHAAGLHRPLRRRQRARRAPQAARCRGRRAAARARARRAHGRPGTRPAAPQEEEGHAARPRHLPPLGRAHVTARPAGPVTRAGYLVRPARRLPPPIEPSGVLSPNCICFTKYPASALELAGDLSLCLCYSGSVDGMCV